MTSMRRRYVASTSLRRHVPTGNLAPPWPPQYSKPCPPQYSKPSYAYGMDGLLAMLSPFQQYFSQVRTMGVDNEMLCIIKPYL